MGFQTVQGFKGPKHLQELCYLLLFEHGSTVNRQEEEEVGVSKLINHNTALFVEQPLALPWSAKMYLWSRNSCTRQKYPFHNISIYPGGTVSVTENMQTSRHPQLL